MDSSAIRSNFNPEADNSASADETEWLLADGLGGYAMGTASGLLTRRYHGLLVVARRPPVERAVLLNQVVEQVRHAGSDWWPTPMRFQDQDDPESSLVDFERSPGRVRWVYQRDGVRLEKTLFRAHGSAQMRLVYCIRSETGGTLALRPLLSMRDFHALRTPETDQVEIESRDGVVTASTHELSLRIEADGCRTVEESESWERLWYEREFERGQDCVEQLVMPCRFEASLEPGTEVELTLRASSGPGFLEEPDRAVPGVDHVRKCVPAEDTDAIKALTLLIEAADQFVVRRAGGGTSVIAGYPWFADWGRDTMICLPGLFLATGRLDEALGVLRVFAGSIRNGLIPNRFDDYSGGAHYNTVDASLWYLHAATAWRDASGDDGAFGEHLITPCLSIIDAYRAGTDFDIYMDRDGLIAAGSEHTQLTWMDAQRDGVTFTPRFGKCVEINALWHHGLVRTAEAIEHRMPERASELRTLAAKVCASFNERFINPAGGLYDRLEPGCSSWKPVAEIRPNQVFAASLSASPVDVRTRQGIVDVIEEHLLTPYGLRTLAPSDPGYKGQYRGTLFERDAAYHNGTVWPWLLGAFVEARLRSSTDPVRTRLELRDVLRPLTQRLHAWCLNQVSEICEGDAPHRPEGCPAQAWSVAELLRSWIMVTGNDEPGDQL